MAAIGTLKGSLHGGANEEAWKVLEQVGSPEEREAVWDRIRRGDVYTVALTIPEGSNVFDIAARVEAEGLGSKAAFLAATKQDASLINDLDPAAPSLEGYLFPDTYRFARHTEPVEMVAAMVKRFRQAAQGIGLTADYHRTVTLASLVEKETPLDAERTMATNWSLSKLAPPISAPSTPGRSVPGIS